MAARITAQPVLNLSVTLTAFASIAEGLSAIWAMASEDFGKFGKHPPRFPSTRRRTHLLTLVLSCHTEVIVKK